MIKNIFILSIFSLAFAFDGVKHNCNQNQLDLINLSEPHYLIKKDKCYNSEYIDVKPVVDGILEEDFWGHFDEDSNNCIDSFVQEEPNNLEDPTFKTCVKIFHDDQNIYIFGIKPTSPSSEYGYFITISFWYKSRLSIIDLNYF